LNLAVNAAEVIRNDLRDHRGDFSTLAFLSFKGDPTDTVANALRNSINQAGTFDLCNKGFFDKIRDCLGMREYASDNPKNALSLGKWKKADLVLYGTVLQYEIVNRKGILVVEYNLMETNSGSVLYNGKYDSTVSDDSLANVVTDTVQTVLGQTPSKPGLNQFLGWILIVMLLPIFSFTFLMNVTAKRSNKANAMALGIYTLIDCLLAWILMKPQFDGIGSIVIFILFCLAAFFYNVKLMSIAHNKTEPVV
ncbi:MAG: hypothetical protein PHQ75_02955, partial [Thermoguttaceae bacterium]|nr:hypothetical protein [Thermoguttaceae bacterium]